MTEHRDGAPLPCILIVGVPSEIAAGMRQEVEHLCARGQQSREVVAFETVAPFVLSDNRPSLGQGREWIAVLRRSRCEAGHLVDVYDADGSAEHGVACPVCCPEAYAPKPGEPEPVPRKPLTARERYGLRCLLYAWALKHQDDPGETGNVAALTLARLDKQHGVA